MWELIAEALARLSKSEKDKLLTVKTWDSALETRARAKILDELRTDVFERFVVETATDPERGK